MQIINWINKSILRSLILLERNLIKEVSIKEKKGIILLMLLQEWSIKFYILELQVF